MGLVKIGKGQLLTRFATISPTFAAMSTFEDLSLSNPLRNALADLGFTQPTPIQEQSNSVILSGRDMVGIAQTGTGKTFAYLLPLLRDMKYSTEGLPKVLILVPTRELVVQVVEQAQSLTKYMSVRTLGVYGGASMEKQRAAAAQGMDILVATPGRLYDLVINKSVQLKAVKKVVIDEVDVMLDLGFRFQLTNIFELLPAKRQHVMFSATMTEEVDALIDDFFVSPERIAIAISGTPLENIRQESYAVPNFYTKVNLLKHLVADRKGFQKVLIFVANKKTADRLYGEMSLGFEKEICIIHSNKTQNYRLRSLEDFNKGSKRMLIATDVMARGLDLDRITHVINFDTPIFPENYVHRIGRTGRAEQEGTAILFFTPKEAEHKWAIEVLMGQEIPELDFPEEVEITNQLIPEERPRVFEPSGRRLSLEESSGGALHEKKAKNQKVNLGGSYKREIKKKYKKPKTRGDKNANMRKKKR